MTVFCERAQEPLLEVAKRTTPDPYDMCRLSKARLGSYLLKLGEMSLVPVIDSKRVENVVLAMAKDRGYGKFDNDSYVLRAHEMDPCKKGCKYCKTDLDKAFSDAIDQVFERVGWLCLRCVQEKNYQRHESRCTTHNGEQDN
jgi:hypothetical protein